MEDLLKVLKSSSPTLTLIVVLAFFMKTFIEKRIEGIADDINAASRIAREEQKEIAASIRNTSLEIKQEMRNEERKVLVGFREAVEEWQDFLQDAVFNYAFSEGSDANVKRLYERERDLFLKVKVSVVKSCIYLRDEKLEQSLMSDVVAIRKFYFPLIHEAMPRIIDLKVQLVAIDDKLKRVQQNGGKDPAITLTQADRQANLKLQENLTAELQKFASSLVEGYRPIAVKLNELKEKMNGYIYRPIKSAAIDENVAVSAGK